MIDPLLSPKQATTSLERLALMDRPARPVRRKRAMPARTSKIITAGASATALLSMVAGMGWQSGTSSANSAVVPSGLPDTTPTLAPVLPVAQPATSSAAPGSVLLPVVTAQAPAAPVTTATVPTAPVPVVTVAVVKKHAQQVVVPKPVPVATLPAQKVVKHKSHTTTKSSG
ncbi:MAG: hypothetical protein ACXV8L_00850 [Ilumatobacteraceae bacterium]